MSHTKVQFRLEKDEDGYPPFEVEGVWAQKIPGDKFVLDNIPFFARQATLGYVVAVTYEDGQPFYRSTLARSRNSLIRVIFFHGQDTAELRSALNELGCSSERFENGIWRLIAVDVPPATDIEVVRKILDKGCVEGFWDYEEPILRH